MSTAWCSTGENGGGHLSEAIGLVNLFVPKGPVVQLRETGGRVEVLESVRKAWPTTAR